MPQLRMEKNDLNSVPAIPLPEGYCLRTFQPGDEAGLGRIYAASDLGCETPEAVRERMLGHPCFKPERISVIEHEGVLVGTAAAWLEASDPGVGYLHMVGLLPEHRGKRLGAIATLAAVQYTRDEGYTEQRLLTDDWRIPAIKLYIGLGFYPLITDDSHPERWEKIAEVLGRPPALARVRDVR